MKKLVLLLAVATLAAAGGTTSAAGARASEGSGGIPVSFEKHIVDPANFKFQGTTGAAVKGTLASMIVPYTLDASGPVWHFTFEWDVTADVAQKSFVALTDGTLDTATGSVVMDGSVVRGWHLGARVHEEGQLVDPSTLTFAGTIVIMPGARND
jgi:hypothetical protein